VDQNAAVKERVAGKSMILLERMICRILQHGIYSNILVGATRYKGGEIGFAHGSGLPILPIESHKLATPEIIKYTVMTEHPRIRGRKY